MKSSPILFFRYQELGKEKFVDIFSINPDGSEEKQITFNPGPDGKNHDNVGPRYNADKSGIAFLSSRNNQNGFYDIYTLDLLSDVVTQVTFGNIIDMSSVDWSPDDLQLTLTAMDANNVMQVYTMNTDGSNLNQITTGSGDHFEAMWSPSGDYIASSLTPDPSDWETTHIVITSPDGNHSRQITDNGAYHGYPSWTADGDWVLYKVKKDGLFGLQKVNIHTMERIDILEDLQFPCAGMQMPDGKIAFHANLHMPQHRGFSNIYMLDPQTGQTLRLTDKVTQEFLGDI